MLEGMKVLSLCHYLQGPGAVQYLADMGADVIKLEPLDGAYERSWSGADVYIDDVSAFFLTANKNKRSLALNIKSPEGHALICKLVATVDVVVENFRPGVMERLDLGYEDLKAIKPDIIYASATGFGSKGPMAKSSGQDLLLQARTGLMAATGRPSAPTAVGCAAIDQHGAALLAMGILGAYVRKTTTGVGARVESSLFNAGIDLQHEAITAYLCGGFESKDLERYQALSTWYHQTPYGVYKIKDGFVALSNLDATKLAKSLDSDALAARADQNRFHDRDEYSKLVQSLIADLSFSDLAERFDDGSIWYAPVNTYSDLLQDPQAESNHIFRKIEIGGQKATLLNHPITYDGETMPLKTLALEPGAHSREVLIELGLDEATIQSLIDRDVVREPASDNRKTWRSSADL